MLQDCGNGSSSCRQILLHQLLLNYMQQQPAPRHLLLVLTTVAHLLQSQTQCLLIRLTKTLAPEEQCSSSSKYACQAPLLTMIDTDRHLQIKIHTQLAGLIINQTRLDPRLHQHQLQNPIL
jgi:hypothetical protein